jgi:hypothetical protein
VEAEESGFLYYTRYFTGKDRPVRRGRALTPIGSFTILTLDGDNDTWSVTLFAAAGDPPLKLLRHADRFTSVVSACPLHAHWLDGEPITEVLLMGGILDKYRRFVVDGRLVATGFAAVGDAWACTNPSAGRGLSIGLIHAQLLRRAVRRRSTIRPRSRSAGTPTPSGTPRPSTGTRSQPTGRGSPRCRLYGKDSSRRSRTGRWRSSRWRPGTTPRPSER